MPRFVASWAALVVVGSFSAASQAGDPIDLVRGLRENGLPDMALEYLTELSAGKPTPGTLAVIPLERARAKLELAATETDDAKRSSMVTEAKADFDAFLKANTTHPRRAEASLALARLVSVQAKGMVSKANKVSDDEARAKDLLNARPVFQDASKRFSDAAKEFAKKGDEAGLTAMQKKAIKDDLFQAQLDEATNLFQLAFTYPTVKAAANDIVERGKAIDKAKDLFTKLSSEDPMHPLCWVAQAWVGECEREKNAPVEAQKRFEAVRLAYQKMPSVVASGYRTSRFFELRGEFEKAFTETNKAAAFRKAQTLIETWLADPTGKTSRPTPEMFAARYYLATCKYKIAETQIKLDNVTKQPVLQGSARELLQAAEKDFRRLAEPENDYTARASEDRTRAIRLLIGDPNKIDPATLNDFDQCLMAAQVQLYNAVKEAKTDEERVGTAKKVVALYERLQKLPVPKDAVKDAQEALANLSYAYILADKPYEAAVLAESIARTSRNSATASRSGLYAIMAYRQVADKIDVAEAAQKRNDEDRAVNVGLYLDKQFPTDPNTDTARVQITQQLLQTRRYREAFDVTAKVPNSSPLILNARFLQSLAALEMLRTPTTAEGALPAPERATISKKTLADIQAIPETQPASARADARLAVLLNLQVAELYFLNGSEDLPKAEASIVSATKIIGTYTNLTADDKKELELRGELAKMRALYGQSLMAFQAKKYADAVTKLTPILTEAKASGPVTKPDMLPEVATYAKKVDEFRREKILGLAMQARIREGAVDKVAELLDILKKLGGSLSNSAGTLSVLVEGVRPQIDALRKEGKAAEADALATGIGTILDKVAAEPDVKPPTILVLAQGLNSIGNYDKAIEFLQKIEAPADMTVLKKRISDIPDEKQQLLVARYRIAQLESLRACKMAKKFPEADAILKEALTWSNNGDFRKEAAYLLEAKAEAEANLTNSAKLWTEARGKWTELAKQYATPLGKLQAGQKDAKSAFIALLDLKSLPKHEKLPTDEKAIRAALAEQKAPKWLDELLLEKLKAADGKTLVENPIAVAYIKEMRNTSSRLESSFKPLYHDFFFESIRCLTKANIHLTKANPPALPPKLDSLAKQMQELEVANPDMVESVKIKFADLLEETPILKAAYTKRGGKAFLKESLTPMN
jgi:hypothetical protein